MCDMDLGIDVSFWQGAVNWRQAEQAGAKFAFIRAGSINNVTGVPYHDYALETNLIECHLPRGFYWYFRPNQPQALQANHFADLIEGERMELGAVCDIEVSGGMLPGHVQNAVKSFLDTLEGRLGEKPLIYTRASFWNYAVGNPAWASDYPLWCARYMTYSDTPPIAGPWADGRFKPYSWDEWEYWQFSADGNNLGSRFGAESGSIDLNVARLPIAPQDPAPVPDEPIRIELRIPENIEVDIVHI